MRFERISFCLFKLFNMVLVYFCSSLKLSASTVCIQLFCFSSIFILSIASITCCSITDCLPFRPKKPKEVYLRHINEMNGFVDYFFAPQHIKNKIQRILKILKKAHGSTKTQLDEILRKNKMSTDTYHKYKREICANGLVNIVGSMTEEPGEIFHFYKEYYLSPKQLSSEEAYELAIQRFERLIKLRINRSKITSSEKMLKWLENEYSKNEIKKFRTYNFSEFDIEHIYHE